MSVELVTGYFGVDSSGKPNRHVSSSEDGARQAGTVGLGCYALATGSKLSATMEDANTLVVADGDVMMNGRHVSLPDPTSFTIPTGVQGQKVSNLAVLRYEKAAESVESVTPLVLTGEPSTETPQDPAHNEGSILDGDSPVDMPLYRVVTNGINAESPEPLFDVLLPMADLRDSVSQRLDDLSRRSRVVTGTKVIATNYQYAVLLSEPEATSLAGRRLDQARDVAIAVNGDILACDLGVFAMMAADGAVHLRVVGTTGQVPAAQRIRVNYALVLAP